MLRLIHARHGDTESTRDGVIQGSKDIPLNERGIRNAEHLASYFMDTPLDYIISGELQRAYQTAEVIARTKGLTVISDARLNERCWGPYEGVKYEEIDTHGVPIERFLFYLDQIKEESLFHNSVDERKELETLDKIMLRLTSFRNHILSEYRDSTLLIVSHQFTLGYFLNLLLETKILT
ncbi:MAG: histidine phosphatase family protein, partial [Thermodesulfovibrionia bacterium]|nr:histidine phosphatase family protein [Thermodesulfovibrionia bacterium]